MARTSNRRRIARERERERRPEGEIAALCRVYPVDIEIQ